MILDPDFIDYHVDFEEGLRMEEEPELGLCRVCKCLFEIRLPKTPDVCESWECRAVAGLIVEDRDVIRTKARWHRHARAKHIRRRQARRKAHDWDFVITEKIQDVRRQLFRGGTPKDLEETLANLLKMRERAISKEISHV